MGREGGGVQSNILNGAHLYHVSYASIKRKELLCCVVCGRRKQYCSAKHEVARESLLVTENDSKENVCVFVWFVSSVAASVSRHSHPGRTEPPMK